ncbi:Pvc16 family protein [Tenacibaculum tangerinum]|uniref:Pvc16 family protein n=1 Tax=Tenacibaculum tangerinum TaxID=3038772 RepID=A0ABY8L2N3_9FLAO|nr:Pvc16 family protein [Tenacibaculum tangerinum]WGH75697.1 Pvc16 family protein [Tenacibaculum tangerinum]
MKRRTKLTTIQMIAKSFYYTKKVLDQYLKNKFELTDSVVVADSLVSQNGTVSSDNKNKVVITLIHIEQETVQPFYNRNQKLDTGSYEHTSVKERYNLYILVTSSFDDYYETLKFLDASIQFFQINQLLDAHTNSEIPEGIHKLEFEFQKGGDYMQMHNLWSALGTKYQPSVIYKMKLLTIGGNEVKEFISAVDQLTNTATQ